MSFSRALPSRLVLRADYLRTTCFKVSIDIIIFGLRSPLPRRLLQGMFNLMSAMPVVGYERSVYYRCKLM